MTLIQRIEMLSDKGTPKAYDNLIYLEELSNEDCILYNYLPQFISMISDKRYVIRIRGFRLTCRQSKWDNNNIIDNSIDKILEVFKTEEKPTALRQYLAALPFLTSHKENLKLKITAVVNAVNTKKYKDSMSSLLEKDICNLIRLMI